MPVINATTADTPSTRIVMTLSLPGDEVSQWHARVELGQQRHDSRFQHVAGEEPVAMRAERAHDPEFDQRGAYRVLGAAVAFRTSGSPSRPRSAGMARGSTRRAELVGENREVQRVFGLRELGDQLRRRHFVRRPNVRDHCARSLRTGIGGFNPLYVGGMPKMKPLDATDARSARSLRLADAHGTRIHRAPRVESASTAADNAVPGVLSSRYGT